MAIWDELELQEKIEQILRDAQSHDPSHHFGRPFLTSYQIAIEFQREYPAAFDAIGKPVGGKDTGQQDSLTQYIANQLSNRINNGTMENVEGRYLSQWHIETLRFDGGHAPSGGSTHNLSMFRLRD